MRIGLIADTHMPGSIRELWPQVYTAFEDVDVILHAGDLHTLRLVDELQTIAPVYVARGNGDRGLDDERLQDTWHLTFEGVSVCMVHAFPRPGRRTDDDVRRQITRHFGKTSPDVIVYGHTHRESIDMMDDTLCINPGSPTLPRNMSTRLGTIGFLNIDGDNQDRRIDARIYQITDEGIVEAPPVSTGDPVA
jgi:putative phosphoesterase